MRTLNQKGHHLNTLQKAETIAMGISGPWIGRCYIQG